MKQDIKEKWVAALRSGKFNQGRQALKGVDYDEKVVNYCCLGVLAAICGNDPEEVQSPSGEEYLNESFLEQVGLDHKTQVQLAQMNDGFLPLFPEEETVPSHSFPEIADYIEKNL